MATAVASQTSQPVDQSAIEQASTTQDAVSSIASPSSSTTAWIAANGHWNFFADNLRYTSGVGVRNTGRDTIGHLDGVAVSNRLANRVRNGLGSALFDNLAGGVGVRNALLFANPVAYGVANVFDALLANRIGRAHV